MTATSNGATNLLTGKFETAREGRFVEDKTVDASYVTRALDIGHRRATTTLKKNIPYVPLPLSDHDDECVPLVRAKHHDEDRAQGSDDEDHGSTRSSDSNASAPSDDYDSDNHEHRHSKKRKRRSNRTVLAIKGTRDQHRTTTSTKKKAKAKRRQTISEPGDVPRSYKEAMRSPDQVHRQRAIDEELASLKENTT